MSAAVGRFVAVTSTVGLLVGCQAAPPRPLAPAPAIPPSVLERFTLSPDDAAPPLEPIHVLGASSLADGEGVDAPSASIELDDVLASVERHFPLVLAAREELALAEGRLLAARGGFDLGLSGDGKFYVEDYYESERVDVLLEQPTSLWGATFVGGYRIGTGDFAVYDGGEETNEGGELRAGVVLPILKDRTVDARRVALWRARLEREQADPVVLAKRLEVTRKAAEAYWKWVSAGRVREISLRLLALAQDRMEQVRLAVDEGLLPPLTLTENERLIVDRESKLLLAERKLQEAAILLSLYWRDADGRPTVPGDALLPYEFPAPRPVAEVLVPGDERLAGEQRPELRRVALELRKLELDLDLARNRRLPKLDVGVFGSQDLGDASNAADTEGDFELQAIVKLDVPLQRRAARGKQRELEAKLAKLAREVQFLRERVVTEVQDARSAMTQSWLSIEQARENVRLANELAEAERFQLTVGESDLLRVNLREQQAAVAAGALVEVLREYFEALATYRAVLGVPYDAAPESA